MAKTLKSIGFEKIDLEPEIHVQNVVASADLKTDLNLNAIALGLGLENIEYEPEQFPGLVYRIKQPKGSSTHIQLRQTGDHRRQIAGGVRRRRTDRQDAA